MCDGDASSREKEGEEKDDAKTIQNEGVTEASTVTAAGKIAKTLILTAKLYRYTWGSFDNTIPSHDGIFAFANKRKRDRLVPRPASSTIPENRYLGRF